LPFDEVTDGAYAQTFLATHTAAENRRGVDLRGRCPRCGDPMDFPIVTEIFQSTVAPGHSADRNSPDEKTVLCTCQADHPDKPAGEKGCGAYWNIRLTRRRT